MSVIKFEPAPSGPRFGANVIVPRATAAGPGARINEEMYTKLKIANNNHDLPEHTRVRSRDLVRRFIESLKMHEEFGTKNDFTNPAGQWHFVERSGWSIIGHRNRSYAPGLYDPRPIHDGYGNEFYMVLPSAGGVVGSGGFGKVLLFEYNSKNPGSAAPLYKDFVMKISADPSEKEGLEMLANTKADEECVCARLIKEAKVLEYPIYEANLNQRTAREIGYLFGESDTRYFTVMEKGDGTLSDFLSAPGQGVNAMTAFQLVYGMFQDIKYVYEKSQRDAVDRRQKVRNGILMSDAKLDNFLYLKTLETSDGNRKLRIFPCDFGSFCYSWDESQPAVVCSTEYCSPADDYAHVGIACDGYPDDVDDKTGGNFPSIGHVAFCLGTMLMQLMDGTLHDNKAQTKDACCFYKRLGQFELQVRSIDPATKARGPITKEQVQSYLTKVSGLPPPYEPLLSLALTDVLPFPRGCGGLAPQGEVCTVCTQYVRGR
jgi:serine/threonine protein kinase